MYVVSVLETINSHNDLVRLSPQQRQALCQEIRHFLVDNLSKTGGHLASTAATHFTTDTRPDFQILFYPVVTMGENTHQGSKDNLLGKNPSDELVRLYSNELQVNAQTPQAFILHSSDDNGVPVSNSVNYYTNLVKHGVPVTMHLYPIGGHGWGYNENFPYKSQWKEKLEKWLREIR